MKDALLIIGAISLATALAMLICAARSAIRFEHCRHLARHEDDRP